MRNLLFHCELAISGEVHLCGSNLCTGEREREREKEREEEREKEREREEERITSLKKQTALGPQIIPTL